MPPRRVGAGDGGVGASRGARRRRGACPASRQMWRACAGAQLMWRHWVCPGRRKDGWRRLTRMRTQRQCLEAHARREGGRAHGRAARVVAGAQDAEAQGHRVWMRELAWRAEPVQAWKRGPMARCEAPEVEGDASDRSIGRVRFDRTDKVGKKRKEKEKKDIIDNSFF